VEFVIVLVVLIVVMFVITGPLRRERASRATGAAAPPDGRGASELAELEASREAKYREIRDAELDHRTGKLSDADFEAVDRSLRAEAIEILRALDRLGGADRPAAEDPASPGAE
jgi:flagellar biosynthesis/type III secretory pathway M-ring protein FliF/YscJ